MQNAGFFNGPGKGQFGTAVEGFGAALQVAWPSSEAEEAVREAYARYAAVLEEALQVPDVAQRAAEHFAEYERAVAAAFAEADARQRVADAFTRYVGELRQAWVEVDPGALTPSELAALTQQLSWAAGVAGVVERFSSTSPDTAPGATLL